MNRDLTNKEQEFRAAADELRFEVDVDQLWADIEPQLDPVEENKRPVVWWWAGVGMSALLIAAAFVFLGADGDSAYEIANQPAESHMAAEQSIEEHNNANSKTNPATPIDNITPDAQVLEIDVPTSNTNNQVSTQTKISQGKQLKRAQIANSKTGTSAPSEISRSTRGDLRTDKKNMNATSTNLHAWTTRSAIVDSLGDRTEMTDHNSGVNGNVNDEDQGAINTPMVNRELVRDREIAMDPLMTRSSDLKRTTYFALHTPTIEMMRKRAFASYWRFAGGVHQSDDRSDMIIGDGTPDLARETALIGINADLSYGREYTNGWRWAVGASYYKNTTRYSNQDQSISQQVINGDTELKIDDFGDVTTVQGDVLVTTINNNDITWHRSHDFVDLQLSAGKVLLQTGPIAMGWDIYGGYNLWSRHTGYYFPKEGNYPITKFLADEDHIYQNRGMSAGTRLTVEWNVGNIGIELAPYVSRGFGSYIEATQNYQLKNSQYGVQLGVVYRP